MSELDIRIGLWGGVGAGKTTFLSVLGRAAAAGRPAWSVVGAGPNASAANQFLLDSERQFVDDNAFALATQIPTELQWRFDAAGRVPKDLPAAFTLRVRDVPGGLFSALGDADTQDLLDYFATCQGIIFLLDPVNEVSPQQAVLDTTGFLRELASQVRRGGQAARLRHHVAVCMTKFDQPAFFDEARRAGWGTQQPDGLRQPRVRDAHATAYFDWLCTRGAGGAGAARAVRENLEAFFGRRIGYFVTSSIGFRLAGRDGAFDPTADMFNYRALGDGQGAAGQAAAKLLHPPHPINVLEPVLWLVKAIRADGRRP